MTFFESFYKYKTENFSRPKIEMNVKHPYKQYMVMDCLRNISIAEGYFIAKNCRVYLDGNLLNAFKTREFIQKIVEFKAIHLVNWNELTSGKDFFIFINHALMFSSELAEVAYEFVGREGSVFEPDGVSIEHHIIIGKYKETSFGVHIDDATDRVFHFNLGPEKKEMILWPHDAYLETYGANEARSFEGTTAHNSKNYEIPPGSCFFLPADYFHVGRSVAGVSIVIAVAFSRLSINLVVEMAMEEIKKGIFLKSTLEDYRKSFDIKITKVEIERICKLFGKRNFSEWFLHANARRCSNASFSEIRPLSQIFFKKTNLDLFLSLSTPPVLIEEREMLHVYSRGKHIKLINPVAIKWMYNFMLSKHVTIDGGMITKGINDGNENMLLIGWLISTQSCIVSHEKNGNEVVDEWHN